VCRQERARSTTRRSRPSPEPCGLLGLAIRALMPLARSSRRWQAARRAAASVFAAVARVCRALALCPRPIAAAPSNRGHAPQFDAGPHNRSARERSTTIARDTEHACVPSFPGDGP
jgi:hypothetical protein